MNGKLILLCVGIVRDDEWQVDLGLCCRGEFVDSMMNSKLILVCVVEESMMNGKLISVCVVEGKALISICIMTMNSKDQGRIGNESRNNKKCILDLVYACSISPNGFRRWAHQEV